MPFTIALVGDRDPDITAHRAIETCCALTSDINARWVSTPEAAQDPPEADGIWCVPGGPYADTSGAFAAITRARVTGTPFLGTCAGYQHAIIEFARNVMGDITATSAELEPDADRPLIAALPCALREVTDGVTAAPGSRLEAIWGSGRHEPEYNCGFGLDPKRESELHDAGLKACAHGPAGEPRAVELSEHPFFVGVAFQPERDALEGRLHPIVSAFFSAVTQN